jgi:ethanolamine utilization protein EutM
MQQALGLIETLGYATAVSAADAAVKAANVEITAIEKVIGVSGGLGVTVHFSGDVASVLAAVDAGERAARSVGKVISAHVIPRAHHEVSEKLLSQFNLINKNNETSTTDPDQNQDSEN